ncbi:MAG: tetratricopeptide repeat protein [Verrucomicrobiota bacterium]
MQGLREFYAWQGRGAEWARLVNEITPHFCTGPKGNEDEPFPGRESAYSLVMEYRVSLARHQDRDLGRAANLQEKRVAWDRKQAAEALALPEAVPLDDDQRHRIRSIAMSSGTLGQILMEQGNPDCVAAYEETVRLTDRIGDQAAEATTYYNLGHAFKDLPAIRDLDAAEAAYQRSIDLYDESDRVGRTRGINQIGMVHHERFNEVRAQAAELANRGDTNSDRKSPEDAEKLQTLHQQLLEQAQAAESRYKEALQLCSPGAVSDLGPIHNQLGNFYQDVGQTERAREHYEKDIQICEQAGDRYGAGNVRFNLAVMYLQTAANSGSATADPVPTLERARAYAEAALRDFQHFDGRAADREAKARGLIDRIDRMLLDRS